MKNMRHGGTSDAIPVNRPASALPDAVRDLADLLAEIAAHQIREKPTEKKEGSKK
ncbi:hypothetical protein [Azoarcus sp. KH32C]|uniref:hypothetical protein n=1 Tax=Azoarcus sp. KH32C TaxID=748247 RepID=UPI0002385EA1|nr:hypothetical protein [Azoarcus sp. KH32C]BAL23460.1 hypothetical protein AZKH_1131 [Azoarcus sp. KH32C]